MINHMNAGKCISLLSTSAFPVWTRCWVIDTNRLEGWSRLSFCAFNLKPGTHLASNCGRRALRLWLSESGALKMGNMIPSFLAPSFPPFLRLSFFNLRLPPTHHSPLSLLLSPLLSVWLSISFGQSINNSAIICLHFPHSLFTCQKERGHRPEIHCLRWCSPPTPTDAN